MGSLKRGFYVGLVLFLLIGMLVAQTQDERLLVVLHKATEIVGKAGLIYQVKFEQVYSRWNYPVLFDVNQTDLEYPYSFSWDVYDEYYSSVLSVAKNATNASIIFAPLGIRTVDDFDDWAVSIALSKAHMYAESKYDLVFSFIGTEANLEAFVATINALESLGIEYSIYGFSHGVLSNSTHGIIMYDASMTPIVVNGDVLRQFTKSPNNLEEFIWVACNIENEYLEYGPHSFAGFFDSADKFNVFGSGETTLPQEVLDIFDEILSPYIEIYEYPIAIAKNGTIEEGILKLIVNVSVEKEYIETNSTFAIKGLTKHGLWIKKYKKTIKLLTSKGSLKKFEHRIIGKKPRTRGRVINIHFKKNDIEKLKKDIIKETQNAKKLLKHIEKKLKDAIRSGGTSPASSHIIRSREGIVLKGDTSRKVTVSILASIVETIISKIRKNIDSIANKVRKLRGDYSQMKRVLKALDTKIRDLIKLMREIESKIINSEFFDILDKTKELQDIVVKIWLRLAAVGLKSEYLLKVRDDLRQIYYEGIGILRDIANKMFLDKGRLSKFISYKSKINKLSENLKKQLSSVSKLISYVNSIFDIKDKAQEMMENITSDYARSTINKVIDTASELISTVKHYLDTNGVPSDIPSEWLSKKNALETIMSHAQAVYALEMRILRLLNRTNKLIDEILEIKSAYLSWNIKEKVTILNGITSDIKDTKEALIKLLKWENKNLETVLNTINNLESKINKIDEKLQPYRLDAELINIYHNLTSKTTQIDELLKQLEEKDLSKSITEIKQELAKLYNKIDQFIKSQNKSEIESIKKEANLIKKKLENIENEAINRQQNKIKNQAEEGQNTIKNSIVTKEELIKIVNEKFDTTKQTFKDAIHKLIATVTGGDQWWNVAYHTAVSIADGIIDSIFGAAKSVADWAINNLGVAAEIVIKALKYGWSFVKVVAGFLIAKILEAIGKLLSILNKGIIWFIEQMGSVLGLPEEIVDAIKRYAEGTISTFIKVLDKAAAYAEKWVKEGAKVLGEALNSLIIATMNTINAGIRAIMQMLELQKFDSIIQLIKTAIRINKEITELINTVEELMLIAGIVQTAIEAATMGLGAIVTRVILPTIAAIIVKETLPTILEETTGIRMDIEISIKDIVTIATGGISSLVLWLTQKILGFIALERLIKHYLNTPGVIASTIKAMIAAGMNPLAIIMAPALYTAISQIVQATQKLFDEETGERIIDILENKTVNIEAKEPPETSGRERAEEEYNLYLAATSAVLLLISAAITIWKIYKLGKEDLVVSPSQLKWDKIRGNTALLLATYGFLLGYGLERLMEIELSKSHNVKPKDFIEDFMNKRYNLIPIVTATLTVVDTLGELAPKIVATTEKIHAIKTRNKIMNLIATAMLEPNKMLSIMTAIIGIAKIYTMTKESISGDQSSPLIVNLLAVIASTVTLIYSGYAAHKLLGGWKKASEEMLNMDASVEDIRNILKSNREKFALSKSEWIVRSVRLVSDLLLVLLAWSQAEEKQGKEPSTKATNDASSMDLEKIVSATTYALLLLIGTIADFLEDKALSVDDIMGCIILGIITRQALSINGKPL